MKRNTLIDELQKITKENQLAAIQFLQLNDEQLLNRPGEKKWNILECIEHLNLYGAYYIPEINRVIENATESQFLDFKSSILGKYFVKSVMPKQGETKINALKTFADKDPIGTTLDKDTIHAFIQQQDEIARILNASRYLNIQKLKTGICISRWIKLRLGDTLAVLIQHNARHIQQANALL